MSYANAEKLLQLCLLLADTRIGLTIDQIAEKFEVNRRTAERMRDAAQNLFPSLEFIRDENNMKRWRIPRGSVQSLIDFTARDFASLGAATALLRREGREEDAISLAEIEAKIRATLPSAKANRIEPDLELLMQSEGLALRPGPSVPIDTELLQSIRKAILSSVCIRFQARLRNGQQVDEVVAEPYGILYGQRPYLLARRPQKDGMRQYRLQSITDLMVTDIPFIRDETFNIATYARSSFGIFREEPFDCEWRFRPSAAQDAAEYRFHPDQTIEFDDDGALTVRFRAGGALEMAWHLHTWGEAVEVIKPADFWDRVNRGRSTVVEQAVDRTLLAATPAS